MIKPADVHVQLRSEEAHLIMMAMDAGIINLQNFQALVENVFYEKKSAERHAELMKKLIKVREEFAKQAFEKKKESSIILPNVG